MSFFRIFKLCFEWQKNIFHQVDSFISFQMYSFMLTKLGRNSMLYSFIFIYFCHIKNKKYIKHLQTLSPNESIMNFLKGCLKPQETHQKIYQPRYNFFSSYDWANIWNKLAWLFSVIVCHLNTFWVSAGLEWVPYL